MWVCAVLGAEAREGDPMDGEQMSVLWSLATESHSGRLRQTGGVVEETQELTEAKCPLRKRRGKGSVQGSFQV